MKLLAIVGLCVVIILLIFAVGWFYGASKRRPEQPLQGHYDEPIQLASTRPTYRGESYYMERGVRMCSKCRSRDHDRDDCPEVSVT